jgi:hypothetical protein
MDVTEITLGLDDWAHLAALIGFGDRAAVPREFSLPGHAREADRALLRGCRDRHGNRPPSARPETQVAGACAVRVHLPVRFLPVPHSWQSSTSSSCPVLDTCREERVRAILGHAFREEP